MKIFGCLDVPAVNLLVSAERASCYIRRDCNALAAPDKKRIIAMVENEAGGDLTFCGSALLHPDLWRNSRDHVQNLVVLQAVAQRPIHEPKKRLTHFH